MNLIKSKAAKILNVIMLAMVMATLSASAALVEVGTNGDIEFDPTAISAPIKDAAVSAFLALTGLVILGLGVAWIFKIFGARKKA